MLYLHYMYVCILNKIQMVAVFRQSWTPLEIVNPHLLLASGHACVGVCLSIGSANWQVLLRADTEIVDGS